MPSAQRYSKWDSNPENRASRNEHIRRLRLENPEKYRVNETRYRRKKGILSVKEVFEIKQRKILHSAEVREKAWKTEREKKQFHQNAMFWSLISPCGQVFKFRNLNAFVETNKHLFTPHQLECLMPTKGRPLPRIIRLLGALSPRRKRVSETIHGWRWHIDGKDHETLLAVLPAPTQ
jgi:hypothetical protein